MQVEELPHSESSAFGRSRSTVIGNSFGVTNLRVAGRNWDEGLIKFYEPLALLKVREPRGGTSCR